MEVLTCQKENVAIVVERNFTPLFVSGKKKNARQIGVTSFGLWGHSVLQEVR